MKSNHIDEYVSSGTSPTSKVSKKNEVPFHQTPIDPSQILTLDELAARLKVSKRWCYEKSRRRSQNPLPTIRIGRYLRFNWISVSAWLRQLERAA
jgi:hypothetical protein